jgi:hypothetical protein
MMLRYYYVSGTYWGGRARVESCLHVELKDELTFSEKRSLRLLLCNLAQSDELSEIPFMKNPSIEIGPRLDVTTPFSFRVVTLCRTIGLRQVIRVEQSLRHKDSREAWSSTLDHATEMIYTVPPESFAMASTG